MRGDGTWIYDTKLSRYNQRDLKSKIDPVKVLGNISHGLIRSSVNEPSGHLWLDQWEEGDDYVDFAVSFWIHLPSLVMERMYTLLHSWRRQSVARAKIAVSIGVH